MSVDQPSFIIFKLSEVGSNFPLFSLSFVMWRVIKKISFQYEQLDRWRQMHKDIDTTAKWFLIECTSSRQCRTHVQPTLHIEKWSLSMSGTKQPRIICNIFCTNLYGSRTLEDQMTKDNTPFDPEEVMWEESMLTRKRTTIGQRKIDTKILCNQYGLSRILLTRKHQDSHNCQVYSTPI